MVANFINGDNRIIEKVVENVETKIKEFKNLGGNND